MKSLKGSNTKTVESFLMETQKEAEEAFTRAKVPTEELTAGGQYLHYITRVRDHLFSTYAKFSEKTNIFSLCVSLTLNLKLVLRHTSFDE